MSSYRLSANGGLQTLSATVGTTQTAACWVVMGEGGRFAYTTNTGSASISSYRVAFNGTLQLLEARAADTGNNPIDVSVSDNGRFLYVLNQVSGTIGGYRIQTDGSLDPIAGLITGLPNFVVGIASR